MEDWAGAVCAQIGVDVADELFFGTDATQAVALCQDCPLREACARLALDAEGDDSVYRRHGIFGGLTPEQRAQTAPERRCPDCGGPIVSANARRCPTDAARHMRTYATEWMRQRRTA